MISVKDYDDGRRDAESLAELLVPCWVSRAVCSSHYEQLTSGSWGGGAPASHHQPQEWAIQNGRRKKEILIPMIERDLEIQS